MKRQRRRRPQTKKAGYHWISGETRAGRERSLARFIGLARLVCRYEELGAEDLVRVVREFLGPLPPGLRLPDGVLSREETRRARAGAT